MAIESSISSVDLVLLGGPTSLNVDVDFGPQGRRGSLIYASNGNPNDSSSGVPADVQPYDLAIDISVSSVTYLSVYQYFSADGVSAWQELAQIIPNAKSLNSTLTFASGQTVVRIPLPEISTDTGLLPSNFNIQINIEGTNPIASSISISSDFFVTNNINYLEFIINASEITTSSVTPLNGDYRVHGFVTIV